MKYRVLKEISLLTIAQAGPKGCKEFSTEWKLLIEAMGQMGWVVDWSIYSPVTDAPLIRDFISWAEVFPKRIAWLIEKGFIEKVEPPFEPVTITLTSQEMVDRVYALLRFRPILCAIGGNIENQLWKVWQSQLEPHTKDDDLYFNKLDKAWDAKK